MLKLGESGMICATCDADIGPSYVAFDNGDEVYCRRCWELYGESVTKRLDRDRALGHTGSDMCGCERCAARADMEYT